MDVNLSNKSNTSTLLVSHNATGDHLSALRNKMDKCELETGYNPESYINMTMLQI